MNRPSGMVTGRVCGEFTVGVGVGQGRGAEAKLVSSEIWTNLVRGLPPAD